MGKLPKDQRHQIPELRELDAKQAEVSKLKKEGIGETTELKGEITVNEKKEVVSSTVQVVETNLKCLELGCEFIGKGSPAQQKSRLNLHMRSHNKTN